MPAYKDENNRGTWYASFFYTDWTGKRRRKKKRGFKTRREALEYERNFLTEPVSNSDITLSKLYSLYMDDVKGKIRVSTVALKENIIVNHILPYFGDKKICDISAANIRMWQNEILKKGLSKTYTRTINSQFSAIMNYAVNYYGLPSNPCKTAGMIGDKHSDEMLYWTLDEYNKFIATVKQPCYRVAFDILYWGGLRRGELMALTPADIVEDGININKSASWRNKELIISEPKTKKSKRIVTLPQFCYDELCDYVSRLYGIKETDRIFDFNSNGVLNKYLDRHAEQAGIKRIRVHDLRHSHASLCVEMGMNILAISERLGHENIETTLNTYSHLYPDKQKMLAIELNKKAHEKENLTNCPKYVPQVKKEPLKTQ